MRNDAARPTYEDGLGWPVAFIDIVAFGAFLAGVRRVDVHDRHPGVSRLVRGEPAELVEGPGVERGPLGLAKPCPLADAPKILQGDSATGALSLGHDPLRNTVIHIGYVPTLLTLALLEQPLRALGPLRLQLRPQILPTLAMPI